MATGGRASLSRRPGRIAFRSDPVSAPELRFGLAVRPPDADVSLRVVVNGAVAFEEKWVEERGWASGASSISRPSRPGEPLEIELSSSKARRRRCFSRHPEILGTAEDRRPNVIVYVVDCLRADHVGAYGYGIDTTPEIDRLAGDAVLFEDVSSCASWTKPSTACLFTSSLPTFHRARTVDDALPRSRTTLAEVFRNEGYVTAAWVANPVIDPRVFFFNQGFDRWVDVRSFEERSRRSHLHDMDPDAADITRSRPAVARGPSERPVLSLPPLARSPLPVRGEAALRLAVRVRGQRGPRPRPGALRRRARLQRPRDRKARRTAEGLSTSTTTPAILVTADHGEEFGEHGASRHGKTLYQQVLHIPVILKLPGSRFAGRRVESAREQHRYGAHSSRPSRELRRPKAFQGRSLLDVIEKGSGADREARGRRAPGAERRRLFHARRALQAHQSPGARARGDAVRPRARPRGGGEPALLSARGERFARIRPREVHPARPARGARLRSRRETRGGSEGRRSRPTPQSRALFDSGSRRETFSISLRRESGSH